MKGKMLSTGEVGRLLQVDTSTVGKWMKKGILTGHTTPGGHMRVMEADLVTFLREHQMPVPKQLAGDGKSPKGCQHVHLTSGIRGVGATCDECGTRFRIESLARTG